MAAPFRFWHGSRNLLSPRLQEAAGLLPRRVYTCWSVSCEPLTQQVRGADDRQGLTLAQKGVFLDPKFVQLLACPETGLDLSLEIEERFPDGTVLTGQLIRSDGQKRYPVVNGIPRFVSGESYADSFDFEWHTFKTTQIDSHVGRHPDRNATMGTFLKQTGFTAEKLRGKVVVEFGCGAGRFLHAVRRLGGIAVGIDITNAVEVARNNLGGDRDVFIAQASVTAPPFKKDVFDHGFTIGVLHHTPSPAKGLKNLVDVVKPGGAIAVSVYPEGGFYSFPSVYWMRKFVNTMEQFLGRKCAYRFAMSYAGLSACVFYPLFRLVEKIPLIGKGAAGTMAFFCFVVILARGVKARMLDTFDAITPRYASTHTPEDVEFWLETFCCEEIESTDVRFSYSGARPANYRAKKSDKASAQNIHSVHLET